MLLGVTLVECPRGRARAARCLRSQEAEKEVRVSGMRDGEWVLPGPRGKRVEKTDV